MATVATRTKDMRQNKTGGDAVNENKGANLVINNERVSPFDIRSKERRHAQGKLVQHRSQTPPIGLAAISFIPHTGIRVPVDLSIKQRILMSL